MVNCESFISNAVNFCLTSAKGYSDRNDIIRDLTAHDNNIHSKFRYSIARDITRYLLHAFSEHIISVRLYGSTMEYTAGIYSDIDIIIRVKLMPMELAETLKSLNTILSENYYLLIGKDPEEWSYLIDAHIINEDPKEKKQASRAYLEHIYENNSVEIC